MRAGRRRKFDVHRYPNGSTKRAGAIPPTPELALKRAALAAGGDPAKTSTPLDLMLLHKIIDEDTARAGRWFAYCARAVLGPPWQKNILNTEPLGGEMSESKRARLENEYLAAIAGLSRGERDALIDLLHFRKMPFWLLAAIAGRRPRPHDIAERTVTLAALAKLRRQWDAYHRGTARPVRGAMAAAAE
jgi:hypothetical protein